MHFKVVLRAAKALQLSGRAALRFNFRGVGHSDGVYDRGEGEQEDARSALDYVEGRFPGLPLVLGGFSFGSVIALHVAARDLRVKAVFALGLPLTMVAEDERLDHIAAPRLFVQGDQDVFGPGEALRTRALASPPPREVVLVPGADHFFTGHLEALQAAVAGWAESRPWVATGESRA